MAIRLRLPALLNPLISRHHVQSREPSIKLTKRLFSTAQAKAVLMPFYRAVHPDYFEQYPQQKGINEESLKYLNSYLSSLESDQNAFEARTGGDPTSSSMNLQFFIHPSAHARAAGSAVHSGASAPEPKSVTVCLQRGNLRAVLKSIVTSVDLGLDSTVKTALEEKIEGISETFPGFAAVFDDDEAADFFSKGNSAATTTTPSFSSWLRTAAQKAAVLRESSRPTRQEINSLTERMAEEHGCREVKVSSQWSPGVALGALKRLQQFLSSLGEPLRVHLLQDSTVHLSHRNGISIEGDVHFNSNSLIAEWIKVLPKLADNRLRWSKLCDLEDFISKCLGNIKIERYPLNSPASYNSALKTFHANFTVHAKPVFRPGTMDDHSLMIVPASLSASLQSDGVFLIPCKMSQFEATRYLSSEYRRAAKMRQVHQRPLDDIQTSLKDIKDQLDLKTLCVSDTVGQSETLSFLNSMKLALPGLLWSEGISASDFDVLKGQHVVVDQARGVTPVGVVHVPWDLK